MRIPRRTKWIMLALIVANEIRGVVVVTAIGWPILKAVYSPLF